jgi:hypothetical protein
MPLAKDTVAYCAELGRIITECGVDVILLSIISQMIEESSPPPHQPSSAPLTRKTVEYHAEIVVAAVVTSRHGRNVDNEKPDQ